MPHQDEAILGDRSSVASRICIYADDLIKVYHYDSAVQHLAPPLLIIFATINRPDILDLAQDVSFMHELQNTYSSVYLLDWGYPQAKHAALDLADYLFTYLDRAVQAVRKHSQQMQVNLLGICQGGLLSLCYTACYPAYIHKLILISTPIDCHTLGDHLSHCLNLIDSTLLADSDHLIPGQLLTAFFMGLDPIKSYVKHLYSEPTTQAYLMQKWLQDTPDQPPRLLATFIRECYQANKILNNTLIIKKHKLNFKAIKQPILNIMASKDHLVPSSASCALQKLIHPNNYTEYRVDGGHINIYLKHKIMDKLVKHIVAWLSAS